jgi:hypothetical protein
MGLFLSFSTITISRNNEHTTNNIAVLTGYEEEPLRCIDCIITLQYPHCQQEGKQQLMLLKQGSADIEREREG